LPHRADIGRLCALGTREHRRAATMAEKSSSKKRRYQRIELPQGMAVAWQESSRKEVARVKTLSLGGLFISAVDPSPVGTTLKLVFEVPGGHVRARAIVRSSLPGTGMGIEFISMNYEDRGRLAILLKRLLH
jgi:hypothetical protein